MEEQHTQSATAVKELERAAAQLQEAKQAIGRIVFGQKEVIDQTLVTLLAGGHGLLVGVPGLAKTLLVDTIGTVFGLDAKRIQFTPDLMPSDIVGSEVLEESTSGTRSFRFIKGPVFCQLLMADEINRASPRTQSALLQAMQEHHVTIAGNRNDLPRPFHVLATQNPIEQEGTYPLPEAQLDRFLMQVNVDFPDINAEREMILATTGASQEKAEGVMSADDLQRIQSLLRHMPVGEKIVNVILNIVRDARPTAEAHPLSQDQIAWGPGPRASQAFVLCARATALLEGRLSPSIDDVLAIAKPVLRHRMALKYAARAEGVTLDDVIERLCQFAH